jgi:hypothetical protein
MVGEEYFSKKIHLPSRVLFSHFDVKTGSLVSKNLETGKNRRQKFQNAM